MNLKISCRISFGKSSIANDEEEDGGNDSNVLEIDIEDVDRFLSISISNNDSYIKSKSSIVASIECENV
ncbi:hypothetical protein DERF_002062 [Dermatophagoides farinae]|uniref:Uncharacterized protein n=1 Tax=Dermatophagoides farinae TaxID=6954 RepID=A0A922IAR9_DERFA|nr:hypothetical protein DERF_002062 [Dermatophagoides farinae]